MAKVCEGLVTTRLAHADLSDNGLADDGAAALFAALPAALLAHLRHLALATNGIDAGGAQPLADLLTNAAPSLTSLTLADNDLQVPPHPWLCVRRGRFRRYRFCLHQDASS